MAVRLIAFTVILYAVYMITLVVDGVGLYLGVIPGGGGFAITIVPAIFGAVVIGLFLGLSTLPADVDSMVGTLDRHGEHRVRRLMFRLAAASAAAASGVRTAIGLLRERNPSLFGAVVWWGFDIAVLWACFRAFGGLPAAEGRHRDVPYFVGDARQRAPAPGRDRWRRRRDDRREFGGVRHGCR